MLKVIELNSIKNNIFEAMDSAKQTEPLGKSFSEGHSFGNFKSEKSQKLTKVFIFQN